MYFSPLLFNHRELSIEAYIKGCPGLAPYCFCFSSETLQAPMTKIRGKLKPNKSSHTRHRLFFVLIFFLCLFLSAQDLEWLSFPILSSCCAACGGPKPTRSSTCHCKFCVSCCGRENTYKSSSLPPKVCSCFPPNPREQTRTRKLGN